MLPSIEELRKMRKNLGISQKELARISGVSQSYIARLEKGSINPTYDKVRKIFDYLNRTGQKAIFDAGHTQVDPGTLTCVGIGPAESSALDPITGSFKLL